MNEHNHKPLASMRGFLVVTAALAGGGWTLSLFGQLRLIAWVGFLGAATALWIARRTAGSWRALMQEVRDPLASPATLLVLGIVIVSGLAWPPSMLDSLTYRLPRLLLWLEAGSVQHMQSAEMRLDFLCPVWEFCTAPLVLLGGLRLTWLWGLISWLACQILFFHWALPLTDHDRPKARSLALLANTSAFAVLQASSTANDLLAAVFVCVALHFVREFEAFRRPSSVRWSALAFALATGTKPHFATLGLPYLAWLFLARSAPWRCLIRPAAIWLLPLALLCSAAPTFALNQRTYGSWMGPARESRYAGDSPSANVVLGTFMMAWQCAQPCVNPLALVLNPSLQRFSKEARLTSAHPLFTLRMPPILMVDNASLGTLTSFLFAIGLFKGIRARRSGPEAAVDRWALAAGLVGFAIAVSQFLPSTVGRSFFGFILLAMPLVTTGWCDLSARSVRCAVAAAVVGSVLTLIIEPGRPLWPASWFQRCLVASGHETLARVLIPYLKVPERRVAGRSLAEQIPDREAPFVALIAENRPLLPLLTLPGGARRVLFLRTHAAPAELLKTGATFVLRGGPTEVDYPELTQFLNLNREFELLASAQYTSLLQVGPETWQLYRRRGNIDPPQRNLTTESNR